MYSFQSSYHGTHILKYYRRWQSQRYRHNIDVSSSERATSKKTLLTRLVGNQEVRLNENGTENEGKFISFSSKAPVSFSFRLRHHLFNSSKTSWHLLKIPSQRTLRLHKSMSARLCTSRCLLQSIFPAMRRLSDIVRIFKAERCPEYYAFFSKRKLNIASVCTQQKLITAVAKHSRRLK